MSYEVAEGHEGDANYVDEHFDELGEAETVSLQDEQERWVEECGERGSSVSFHSSSTKLLNLKIQNVLLRCVTSTQKVENRL